MISSLHSLYDVLPFSSSLPRESCKNLLHLLSTGSQCTARIHTTTFRASEEAPRRVPQKKAPRPVTSDLGAAPSFFALCQEPLPFLATALRSLPAGRSSDSRIFLLPAPSHPPLMACSGSLQVSSPVTAAGPCRICLATGFPFKPERAPTGKIFCFVEQHDTTGPPSRQIKKDTS